jgi:hypothetical protein
VRYDVAVIGLGRVGLPLALVGPWNALGTGQVFACASEVVALRA